MQKFHVKFLAASFVAAVAWSGGVVPIAGAADVVTPSYQVKLLLKPEAVSGDGSPSEAFRSQFSVLGESGSERSRYFDTADHFYASQGWSIRIRNKAGQDSLDVTFKYRDELQDNSLSKETVARGLEKARENNFDASDTNYAAQVNASFITSTLDFSNKKYASCLNTECDVPAGIGAKALLADLEPGKMRKATGQDLISLDLFESPEVVQNTWRVEIGGIKTDLEVSQFAGRTWVEISEEESSRKDALSKRDTLISELARAGLLEPADAFKTGTVLAERGL